MSRLDIIRIPQALAAGNAYHEVRCGALDTIVAICAIASDSARHPEEVYGALQRANHDARLVDWKPLTVRTSCSELGSLIGRERRPSSVMAELQILRTALDPSEAPLLLRGALGPRGHLILTLSPWLHTAVRGGKVGHAYLRLDDYASLHGATSRRAYVWLAGWAGISGGDGKHTIAIDQLASHLWADAPGATATRRMRRARTLAALQVLDDLPHASWRLQVTGSHLTVERRPALAVVPCAPQGSHLTVVGQARSS